MRAATLALALLAMSCRPSATVERTTPVADLQVYRSVLVRAGGFAGDKSGAAKLEIAVADALRSRCTLQVDLASVGAVATDLELDLTIKSAGRGSDGLFQPTLAKMDVLAVLSDAVDGELVGSALVRGTSSMVQLRRGETPEQQARAAIAGSLADVLVRSGCGGPRLARRRPGRDRLAAVTLQPASASFDGQASSAAAAHAANEEGKRKFRAGDPSGALAEFHRAMTLSNEPRFAINICLAHEALEHWDAARKACRRVLTMKPPDHLADKANQRLAIIDKRVAQGPTR